MKNSMYSLSIALILCGTVVACGGGSTGVDMDAVNELAEDLNDNSTSDTDVIAEHSNGNGGVDVVAGMKAECVYCESYSIKIDGIEVLSDQSDDLSPVSTETLELKKAALVNVPPGDHMMTIDVKRHPYAGSDRPFLTIGFDCDMFEFEDGSTIESFEDSGSFMMEVPVTNAYVLTCEQFGLSSSEDLDCTDINTCTDLVNDPTVSVTRFR